MLRIAYNSVLSEENPRPYINDYRRQNAANYLSGAILMNTLQDPKKVLQEVEASIDALWPQYPLLPGGDTDEFMASKAAQTRQGEKPFMLLYPKPAITAGYYLERPTVFYRSDTHGVWRALITTGYGGWYTKEVFGFENSTDAPIALQKTFSKLAQPRFLSKAAIDMGDLVETDMQEGTRSKRLASDIMIRHGVGRYFAQIDGIREQDLFAPGKQPDLKDPVDAWDSTSDLYKEIESTVYNSEDQEISYLVNRAKSPGGDDQYWVGTAEVNDPETRMTRLGLASLVPHIPTNLLEPPIGYDRHDNIVRRSQPTDFDEFMLAARRKIA